MVQRGTMTRSQRNQYRHSRRKEAPGLCRVIGFLALTLFSVLQVIRGCGAPGPVRAAPAPSAAAEPACLRRFAAKAGLPLPQRVAASGVVVASCKRFLSQWLMVSKSSWRTFLHDCLARS